jgi:hypothetical protein
MPWMIVREPNPASSSTTSMRRALLVKAAADAGAGDSAAAPFMALPLSVVTSVTIDLSGVVIG